MGNKVSAAQIRQVNSLIRSAHESVKRLSGAELRCLHNIKPHLSIITPQIKHRRLQSMDQLFEILSQNGELIREIDYEEGLTVITTESDNKHYVN